MAVLFDTLKLAERLEAAGMPPTQARGVAAAIGETASGDVATRQDLQVAVAELRGEIEKVRGEVEKVQSDLRTEIAGLRNETAAGDASLRTEIRDVEIRLLRAMTAQAWTIIGAVAAIVGLAAALSKLIH